MKYIPDFITGYCVVIKDDNPDESFRSDFCYGDIFLINQDKLNR